jgi:glutamyl-tRNA reductase
MTTVKLISISHETANLPIRSLFHLSEEEQEEFTKGVKKEFDINGLLIFATCNRTEIYFETENTSTTDLLNHLIEFKNILRSTEYVNRNTDYVQYFNQFDNSAATIQYLLEVISGLRSLVVGDMQIISQFKTAYSNAQSNNLQGKVLERMAQSVFKMHKRIQNETDFRKGSASTSYLALLATRQIFGKLELKNKQVLLIGAGEIIQEVAKYSEKFDFDTITIINRTKSKAENIAAEHGFEVGNYENINNEILKADIIISGVSNQSNLIHTTIELEGFESKKLFIDLGMPANIDQNILSNPNFNLIDIDQLNTKTEKVEAKRQAAIEAVEMIINNEKATFNNWLQKLPVNQSLGKLKNHIQALLTREMETQFSFLPEADRKKLISRLSQQLIKQPAKTLNQQAENPELAKALETVFAL